MRHISKQIRQRDQTTNSTLTRHRNRNRKTDSISTHTTVAKLEARPPLRSISQEALTASSYDLSPTLPYPPTDLSSTRPPPLDLPDGPTRAGDGSVTLQNRVSYFYQLGKAFLTFYKAGFKNIWSNYKEYRPLRKRFHSLDLNRSIKYGSIPRITRRDIQLHHRTSHDLKKLLPFGLVFLICGEFTPLVIPLLGTIVVPYTCRIPKQVQQNLQKALTRLEHIQHLTQPKPPHQVINRHRALAYAHNLDPFGLATRNLPLLSTPLWRLWVQPKLQRRMDDLLCDAILIAREGGAPALDPAELFQFAVKIRKPAAMRALVAHYAAGGDPSRIPETEIAQTRKEVQVFLEEIRRALLLREEGGGAGTNRQGQQQQQQAVEIFVDAVERTAAAGVDAPYVPPGEAA